MSVGITVRKTGTQKSIVLDSVNFTDSSRFGEKICITIGHYTIKGNIHSSRSRRAIMSGSERVHINLVVVVTILPQSPNSVNVGVMDKEKRIFNRTRSCHSTSNPIVHISVRSAFDLNSKTATFGTVRRVGCENVQNCRLAN